jgi:hypothetical protein
MLQPLTKSWEGYRKGTAALLVIRPVAAAGSYAVSQETLMDVLAAWREQSYFSEPRGRVSEEGLRVSNGRHTIPKYKSRE